MTHLRRFKDKLNVLWNRKWKYVFFRMLTRVSPVFNSKYLYKRCFKKDLDLTNPKGFNEKIQWLKLNRYGQDELVKKCANKWGMREYVKECGLEEILVPMYAVYDRIEEVDWGSLPEQFVIKSSVGSGTNYVFDGTEELDVKKIENFFRKRSDRKQWLTFSELQYRNAISKILCEKYLKEQGLELPLDYKIFVFNGEPQIVELCVDRSENVKFIHFDTNWNYMKISTDPSMEELGVYFEKPRCLDKMLESARILSKPFAFVRCDFYVIDNRPYIGELTFTPSGGLDTTFYEEWELKMGEMLRLEF